MGDESTKDGGNLKRLLNFIKQSRQKTNGDIIAADVDKEARGIVVGKNIIQIGTIKIPIWAVALVTTTLVVIAFLSLYNFLNDRWRDREQQEQLGTIVEVITAPSPTPTVTGTATPTPTATPLPVMRGSFNVVIAEFHVQGQGEGIEIAERLVQDFANAIELTVDELESSLGKLDFRPPQATGQIAGEDSLERAANARALARQIEADIVIYGVVAVEGLTATIIPEFYINESVNDGLVEAWEITGQYEMGHSLVVERVNNRESRSKTADMLLKRFQALTLMIDGLAAYVVGNYKAAEEKFTEALTQEAWDNREVFYVMVGNAVLQQKRFQEAEANYRKAIEANGRYSRAYIGLGSAFYGQAQNNGRASNYNQVSRDLLTQAIERYQQALQPDVDRPPLADVESKVNFSIGQVYFLQALLLQDAGQSEQVSPLLMQAIQAFQRVISEYEQGDEARQSRLRERAAHAYARLGLIYRFANQLTEARQAYEQALALLPALQRVQDEQARYEAALGDIHWKQGDPQTATHWYELAVEHALADAPEKLRYQETLAKLKSQITEGDPP